MMSAAHAAISILKSANCATFNNPKYSYNFKLIKSKSKIRIMRNGDLS